MIDEAHRATGDYAYCKIIRLMEDATIGYRIMALTATPGNTLEQVQDVIKNLCINKMEIKSDNDEDVRSYIFAKQITPMIIRRNEVVDEILIKLNEIIEEQYKKLKGLYIIDEKTKNMLFKLKEVNRVTIIELYESFTQNKLEFFAKFGRGLLKNFIKSSFTINVHNNCFFNHLYKSKKI